jgi:transcriptional regulator GlxA family with amidase domain
MRSEPDEGVARAGHGPHRAQATTAATHVRVARPAMRPRPTGADAWRIDGMRPPGIPARAGGRHLQDQVLLDWVKQAAGSARWLASVCTGAGVYAAAGLLAQRRATTHWAFRDVLASMGVDVSTERVVVDEPFVSGAGVSAGIDMALALTARVHGADLARQIQLMIEYDPQPPFDAGSPEKAGPELVAATLARFAAGAAAPDLVQATADRLAASR